MKKTVLSIVITCIFIVSGFSQATFKTETIEASQVPASVTSSFNSKYSGVKVVRWEKHIFTNKKGKKHAKFVCIFDKDGLRSRSRYMPNGTALSATTYYRFKNVQKLPEPIKKYAKTKYPDFKLTGGEKELSHKNGKYVYRIRLKKGPSKVVVYLNENGEEINKDNIDGEILENENDGGSTN